VYCNAWKLWQDQGQEENSALFQGWLIEALKKYTNVSPSTLEGQLSWELILLVSPWYQKETAWDLSELNQLLDTAFGMFN
jgi:hypothetical protein